MTRFIPVTLLFAAFAAAAPIPKDTERDRIEARFGKIADPTGDCVFKLDGDTLSVTLPTNTSFDLCHRRDDVPKLLREAAGDFVLTVRIVTDLPKGAKGFKSVAYIGGGVQLTGKKPDEWAKVVRCVNHFGDNPSGLFAVESPPTATCNDGFGTGYVYPGLDGQSHHLRLTRKGKTLTSEASADGKEWKAILEPTPVPADEKLTVALFALHSSDKARTVTFSEYSIRPLKEEKK